MTDGVTCIVVDRSGKTRLGRDLSEFTIRPFRIGQMGEFSHMLGYQLYLKTGKIISQFRTATPKECLELYNATLFAPNRSYTQELCLGAKASVFADVTLVEALKESTLPFVNREGDSNALLNYYTKLRTALVKADL